MTASISQNTENSKVTDAMASKAATEAAEGGEAVKSTVAAMKQIAKKIVINDDIAYQTNLLALNAAIEAARAGEHGRALPWWPLKCAKLARAQPEAAQEIGEVASSSVELAERGALCWTRSAQHPPHLGPGSGDHRRERGAVERRLQINTAISQLSQTTQQNASASEELAATAEEMSGQVEELQSTIAFFKVRNDGSSDPLGFARRPAACAGGSRRHAPGGALPGGFSDIAPDESHPPSTESRPGHEPSALAGGGDATADLVGAIPGLTRVTSSLRSASCACARSSSTAM